MIVAIIVSVIAVGVAAGVVYKIFMRITDAQVGS